MDEHSQAECTCCDHAPREPMSALSIPQHQLDQAQELLAQSADDKENPSTWDFLKIFKRCVNEHVFPAEQYYCHVCGCPPQGPKFAVLNVNALKFGLTKCSNGHYFNAKLLQCNICGKPAL